MGQTFGRTRVRPKPERPGIKESAALRALPLNAPRLISTSLHIASLPAATPWFTGASASQVFVLNRMPFAFLCLEVFFAVKDRDH